MTKHGGFNDTYISSRYKAWPPGKDKPLSEAVTLTNDRKKAFEEKGWRFERTQIRSGDRFGSQYQ